jgi:hypothetical protein
MKETTLGLPQLALIAGTRGMLGAGLGLLLGGRLSPDVRRAVGVTLVAVGVVTTIPLAMTVFGGRKEADGGAPPVPKPSTPVSEQREAERVAAAT